MAKKHFVKIVTGLFSFIKMILGLWIYFEFTKKTIILSLIIIDTLNFTMYFFEDFDMPFKNTSLDYIV